MNNDGWTASGALLAVVLTLGALPKGNAALAMDASAPSMVMQPVINTYHGVAVSDPYRWLEEGSAP